MWLDACRAYQKFVLPPQGRSAGNLESSLPNLQQFLAFTKVLNAQRVLVLGCGNGYEVEWLRGQGLDAVGVTLMQEEADQAKTLYPAANVVRGDMHDLSIFKDGEFDAVFAREVLEHSPAFMLVVGEIWYVLRPGGLLYFTFPSARWDADPQHATVISERTVLATLPKVGFDFASPLLVTPYGNFTVTSVFAQKR